MLKDILLLTVFPACMAFAAAYDLFTMTVPNRLTLALVAGFVCLAPFVGLSLPEIGIQIAMAAGALLLGMALFAKGWIGGGDAKFFAATVLWLDPQSAVLYGVASAILGGVLTLLLLGYRGLPLPAPLMRQGWASRLHQPSEGVPYGIALAAGGLMAYGHTVFMTGLGG